MRLVGMAFVGLFLACSSRQAPRPSELPDCTPGADACANPVIVGGGGGNAGAADSSYASGTDSAPSDVCGGAASLVSTDRTCLTCAFANCCATAQQCPLGDCQSLISCNLGCGGDTNCVMNQCENTYMAAVTAYTSFKGCLSLNCSGSNCPALP